MFARRTLRANGEIDYGGAGLTASEADELLLRAFKKRPCDLAEYLTMSGDGRFEDAHPRHGNRLRNKFGGRVNEPDKNSTANTLMAITQGGKGHAQFVTVREIRIGEEITCHYGNSFARIYEVGAEASEPQWWETRN